MIPYVVTLLVLVITSMRSKRENQPPASLGPVSYTHLSYKELVSAYFQEGSEEAVQKALSLIHI